ncbi:MAG: fructose-bisphosphatase class II [Bdellovibrionaceae bacterium]|nr:fructose-bisphosphatase class II [Pseudobdellovibrionaceae bacterium]|tara:strand:- start:1922 stop:2878 length:957 start_codon:yes stop_codon:yes gene_type:complete
MDRNYALEFVRVTEAAAIASARLMGRGDEKAADHAAVESMRMLLSSINFDGTVVIGEGERDEAPMLYIGEKVGTGEGAKLDLALDPLEGTTICANGANNSISVIAIAEQGHFLHAPDTYMDKIAVGPAAKGCISLDVSATENIKRVAEAKKCALDELTVVILDRPRHQDLIQEVRSTGARIYLIGDGDVSAAIATARPETGVDLLIGNGGAPEGVISAAALRCLGGDFVGRLTFRNEEEKSRASRMGIKDFDRTYSLHDLASGKVMFCATGVTDGTFLKGVRMTPGGAKTHSMVMRSESGTVRYVEADHRFDHKPSWK